MGSCLGRAGAAVRLSAAVVFVVGSVCALVATGPADASQLIDRNAHDISLTVNAKGEAMVSYTVAGVSKHVLAWGAINAKPPRRDAPQVEFKLDYSGGYGKYRKASYWENGQWTCLPYDGPELAWQVAACEAPDHSYWALQAWQRGLPDLGVAATVDQSAWELRLSHWTGELPRLSISLDWSYRRFDHLFGTFTYDGTGVFGFSATPRGEPLDGFGRNIYIDTYDSAYGRGWRRENSFLTHRTKGSFCYGFYPHGRRPSGDGAMYRATVIGPGVTPDVTWTSRSPGPYDPERDRRANEQERRLADASCTVS